MIEKDHSTVSLTEQCDLFSLSRSGVYYKKRQINDLNLVLLNRLDELHTAHPTWGSRKLRDILRKEGHAVNRKRIQRLMKIACISAIFPGMNTSKRAHQHKIYPYLLRDMAITRVNQVWSTDITYIRIAGGWIYLVAIIDWFSRAILSWRISNTCDRFFCIDALEEALHLFGKPEYFNTDQGSTFTSPDFIETLETAREIKISMDGKGRALDNVYIERFWRTLKYDEVYLHSYENVTQANEGIASFIKCYNTYRPHESLGGERPMEFYEAHGGIHHAA